MELRELGRRYLEHKSTHSSIDPKLSHKIEQIIDTFGSVDPERVTGVTIAKIAQARWSNPGTRLRMLGQVKAIIFFGVKSSLISKAPLIPMPHVYDVRHVRVTRQQCDDLLDWFMLCAPDEYPAVLLLAHTGARLGEVCAMSPADLAFGLVRVKKPVARRSKTIDRMIPMSGRLLRETSAVMDFLHGLSRKRERLSAELGEQSALQRVSNSLAQRIAEHMPEACKSVGIERLRVHDLRHAFASLVAEQGGELADIATLLGHTNINMSMRYRGLVDTKAKSLVRSL